MAQTAKRKRPVLTDEHALRLLELLERRDPAPLGWLFDRAGVKLTPARARAFARRAPVYLSDLTQLTAELRSLVWVGRAGGQNEFLASDALLLSLLRIRAVKSGARAHALDKLRDLLPTPYRAAFARALDARIGAASWPAGVGSIQVERGVLILLLEDLRTATAPPRSAPPLPSTIHLGKPPDAPAEPKPDDFAASFERAFSSLHDRRRSNLVALAPLRDELDTYDREQFDRGLRTLREQGRYVMQTFDGRHGALSPELERAAIRENGRTFVYVARRAP